MYSGIGRPSVPPEQLLKSTILMALYSVRSVRAFCEHLDYDLLFKWFLDLPIDADTPWTTTDTRITKAVTAHNSSAFVKSVSFRAWASLSGRAPRTCRRTMRA